MENQSLQKFRQLAKSERDLLSSPSFLSVIERLEDKYNIKLAMLFIELVVGDTPLENLGNKLVGLDQLALSETRAELSKLLEKFNSSRGQIALSPNRPISFSPEDDEEIKEITSATSGPVVRHDYFSLADEIISELGYNYEEPLDKRLKNTIVAGLKDIRDEFETLELLKKSTKIGGLEMTDQQADVLIKAIADKIKSGLLTEVSETPKSETIVFPQKVLAKEPVKMTLEEKRQQALSAQPKIVEEVVKPVVKSENNLPSVLPVIKEVDGLPVIMSPQGDDLMLYRKEATKNKPAVEPTPVKPVLEKIISPEPIPEIEPIEIKPLQQVAVDEPKPFPQPFVSQTVSVPRTQFQSRKPLVDDIGAEPILTGPIDELSGMTLISFRRLGQTPYQATAKVMEKINLLEQDSYAKKLEGITAWHRSEVNRFYRLLGQASMETDKDINDIISDRLKENKPTLSIEEFNSVAELNSRLRY